MRRILLKNFLSPGDIVMLTAAVRDLKRAQGGRFLVDVRTPCPALWERNPWLTPLPEDDPEIETMDCHYPLIHQSNAGPWHFIHGFRMDLEERLGVAIPAGEFKGDIHLSREEKEWMSQVQEITKRPVPFWIVGAGGKQDFTAKWWAHERYQETVDRFKGRILFVQVGERGHHHPALKGVLDLRGKTDLRQLIRLMHHAQGMLCPVTLFMHLAAAVETRPGMPKNRPCVVIAGGREPAQWEAYPHHQYIHTNGTMKCCEQGGCWKSRVVPLGDGSDKDEPRNLCVDVVHLKDRSLSYRRLPGEALPAHTAPDVLGRRAEDFLPRCLDLIPAEEAVRRIELYFAGGAIEYLNDAEREACMETIPELGWGRPTACEIFAGA